MLHGNKIFLASSWSILIVLSPHHPVGCSPWSHHHHHHVCAILTSLVALRVSCTSPLSAQPHFSCPHRCSITHTLPQPHLSSSAPPSCPTSPSSVSAMFSSPPSQHHCHFCIGLDRELETNELAKLVCSSTLLKWAQPFFNESSNFICSFC
jgi:hypothetical protein